MTVTIENSSGEDKERLPESKSGFKNAWTHWSQTLRWEAFEFWKAVGEEMPPPRANWEPAEVFFLVQPAGGERRGNLRAQCF